jgi:hypothetical protein
MSLHDRYTAGDLVLNRTEESCQPLYQEYPYAFDLASLYWPSCIYLPVDDIVIVDGYDIVDIVLDIHVNFVVAYWNTLLQSWHGSLTQISS